MLEVGKTYELNSGDVHECTRTFKRQDGEVVYVLDEVWYHKDGICGCFEDTPDSRYHVRRCVDDTPTLWRDMTDAEKGALLLAHHEEYGSVEFWNVSYWETLKGLGWLDDYAYRIKPEPKKVETVTMCGSYRWVGWWFGSKEQFDFDTHHITFNLIDGKPDLSSIKMEKI